MIKPEYPNPQFERAEWMNLNGEWEFFSDYSNEGLDRKLEEKDAVYPERITVPFCRESKLSGIGETGFCNCVWYKKNVTIPKNWAGKRILLHIGGCDYYTTVWVNGKQVGTHRGGFISFSFDITEYLEENVENVLTVRAYDDIRSWKQPSGKQSDRLQSYSCSYTRVTGIWETVWLEAVENSYLKSAKYYPDIENRTITVQVNAENAEGMTVEAVATYEGKTVGTASASVHMRNAMLYIPLSEMHLWEIGKGRLYDLKLTLGKDTVKSYFGMRSLGVKDGIIQIDGKPVFQRLVLDQGYYPDGIWTAPDEQALVADIELSMAMGFNGARLHQRVFSQRYLYHCDRLGYMVWEEYGNWFVRLEEADAWKSVPQEWIEIVERDFNSPALIGWCPLNETDNTIDEELVRYLATITRAVDRTRLYIETSGFKHFLDLADLVDSHDYSQDPDEIRAKYEPLLRGEDAIIYTPTWRWHTKDSLYGKVNFISECGGASWAVGGSQENAWGYGNAPKTEEEFLERFSGILGAMMENPKIGGFCYTQLYDIEQEINGLLTYGRVPKFDVEQIRAVVSQPAAAENV